MSAISSTGPPVVSWPMNVWQALESSRGLTAVAASWRERLGAQFEPFKDAFLHRAPGVPKGMPCPRGCGCTHEIVTGVEDQVTRMEGESPGAYAARNPEALASVPSIENRKSKIENPSSRSILDTRHSPIHAICHCDPPTCPEILLTPDDVVLLELSWTKLARALCHVFALDHKPADLGLLNTRQIGSWSVDAVPVILTIQHERAWLRTVLLELLARLRQQFILLAPTAKNIDAVSHELLASSNAAFFSLDATIALTDERSLRLTGAAPGRLFAKFTRQPGDADEDIASRAFALVQQLDAEGTRKAPTVLSVFRMYCIDGFGVTTIARKCETTRTTIRARLKLVETKTGMSIDQLRKISAHFEQAEASFNDSRASHIHRKNLIYDEDDAVEG
jgi:hypothetical protein